MVLSISNFRMNVEEAGAPSGPFNQDNLNLIEGSGIAITVADNPGASRVDVTIATGAGGAKPTADSWEANTETLSGDKTLLVTDEAVHFLDPGGVNREVVLPNPAGNAPYFFGRSREDGLLLMAQLGSL
jgi:hypothetical protein